MVDNTAAVGFATGATKVKRAKAIDMRFHWLVDRARQGQFIVFWAPGSLNFANFVTTHHPPAHNLVMRDRLFTNNHGEVLSLAS